VELASEHETVRRLYATARSDFVRMRYAMLLTMPGISFADDARALEALEPLLANPAAPLRPLAIVISAQIQERLRSQALQQKLDEEQRRASGLQQKLDALKSLEKDMIERGR
jgi:hypothetical protein